MSPVDSMEKNLPLPCPSLPPSPAEMSYREFRIARDSGSRSLFETSLQYTQYLWLRKKPAQAILALCRALYLDPGTVPPDTRQPYKAFTWLLCNYRGDGFLGNPRISFLHQATRVPASQRLKRMRAWALWHLSIGALPSLPTDSKVPENPPAMGELVSFLDQNGLPNEGKIFLEALESLLDSESQT